MTRKSRRPVFLDITRIHLPVTAVISIIHRITGVLFFITIPLMVYTFGLSLSSQDGYDRILSMLDHHAVRLILILLLWGFAHHLFAGIRYLFIDIDIGVSRDSSRMTAWYVVVGGIVVLFGSAVFLL